MVYSSHTTEKIDIEGCTVDLIFVVRRAADPLFDERLSMAWLTTIDGHAYGMDFPIDKVTRENRNYLIENARAYIKRIKSGLPFDKLNSDEVV